MSIYTLHGAYAGVERLSGVAAGRIGEQGASSTIDLDVSWGVSKGIQAWGLMNMRGEI